jgi:hypothetical protein
MLSVFVKRTFNQISSQRFLIPKRPIHKNKPMALPMSNYLLLLTHQTIQLQLRPSQIQQPQHRCR